MTTIVDEDDTGSRLYKLDPTAFLNSPSAMKILYWNSESLGSELRSLHGHSNNCFEEFEVCYKEVDNWTQVWKPASWTLTIL